MAARPPPAVIDLLGSDSDDDVVMFQPRQAAHRLGGGDVLVAANEAAQAVAGAAPAGGDDVDIGNAIGAFPEDQSDASIDGFQTPVETPPTEIEAGQWVDLEDGDSVWIPNEIPKQPSPKRQQPVAPASVPNETFAIDEDLTADACLSHVLAIFPDVSHEHVNNLYHKLDQDAGATVTGAHRIEQIVDQLIQSGDYPKQAKEKQVDLKRKREDEADGYNVKRFEGPDRRATHAYLKQQIAAVLKADFPELPQTTIKQHFTEHKHLFQTYVALANTKDTSIRSKPWRGRPSPHLADAVTIASNSGDPDLVLELQAARKRVASARAERAAVDRKRRVEEENLQRAIEAGDTAECQACFDDLPMNRQIHCSGDTTHFTCFDCATTYIKAEVGEARCRVLCTAGCGANYAHAQLHLLEDKQLLARLEVLQQEKDIRDAGLDDLEECPFCDYKAILPPIEEDFEFRCANPDCEKVSCRRCKSESHIPQTCEEHAKDNKLSSRHKIEEAMTAALMRHCNGCKKQFIKEFGCNKMTCPSCHTLQCYVCSTTIKDYNHFDQGPTGTNAAGSSKKKCPLYDNVEERHEREVKEAEEQARKQVLEENPDMSEKDLEIKLSETVKKATQDRIQRAAGVGGIPAAGAYAGLYFDDEDEEDFSDEDDDANGDEGNEFVRRRRRLREHRHMLQRLREEQVAMRAAIQARRERMGEILGARAAALQAQAQAARPQNGQGGRMVGQAAGGIYDRSQPIAVRPNPNPLPHPDHPGLGGHVAGHGVQAHLAMPRPAYQGLAHAGPPNMQLAGYLPVLGFPPFAPQPQVPAQQPAPAQPGAPAAPFGNYGHGQVVGARNNGLSGPQGLFDAFVEDPFGGGDPDPFGFARLMDAPRFREMLAPGQPRNHALGLNAYPENQAFHDAAVQHDAREQQRQALQNMQNRAGGGQVYELAPGDPRRYHRGPWPGAPEAG